MPRKTDETFEVRKSYRGFLRVFHDILDNYGEELKPFGIAAYVALSRFANKSSEAWPSYKTLSQKAGMSRRQMIYEIQKLERLNLVIVERYSQRSNIYILVEPGAGNAPLYASRDAQTSAGAAPPDAGAAPRTKQKKNYQPNYEIKEKKRNYKPAEYAEFILG